MQKTKGISLIVLVITIIVMVILAGAIILTLNNSGIIDKASNAVDSTNEATVKEVASLGWAEAYANKARTEEELKAGVTAALERNKINTEDYIISVTTSGVTVKNKTKIWIKDGSTIVKGDQVVEIGDSIAYDETAGGTKTVPTNVDWQVLGTDDEGNLLIVSSTLVKTGFRLGYEDTMTTDAEKLAESQNDYKTGVSQLNAECEPYGYGKGVIGKARSITVEDVNKATGFNPETASNGNPFGYGQIHQYGNKVTYAWDGSSNIKYVGTNGVTGSTSYNGSTFTWYDEKTGTFPSVAKSDTTTALPTLESTSYSYFAGNLTISSKISSMIFLPGSDYYWLASPYVNTYTGYAYFGMRVVSGGYVESKILFGSIGHTGNGTDGVRAVVTLSSDIQLTGDSTNGWSY